ncbi:MAG: hypothetical protein JXR37_11775 [Kiritimatiellae bacterium]|nr:hypothetical protein [Kiritimatiellia bacterium]
MKQRCSREAGWTIIEMVIAAVLTGVVVSAAISSWCFLMRGNRINSVQNELDMDVRIAMEYLKRDLRLSSMDKIFFFPEGPGPYTAISFPLCRDDDGDGSVETNAFGKILWDQTVIYHVFESTPNELRRTVFDPRDENLTDEERQTQLADVVAAGDGYSTHNASNALAPHMLFKNLFDWSLGAKGARYDAYAGTLDRERNVLLGSAALTNGSHEFKFSVVGKNPSSSGYKIGLDSLIVSPCGLNREAEAQLPVTAESGATANFEYMWNGSWSGNHHLLFPASAIGHSLALTMDNDRWEETNFRATGAKCEEAMVYFDFGWWPHDYVVTLPGPNNVEPWSAWAQTGGGSDWYPVDNAAAGCAVRILLRGEQMLHGGYVPDSGDMIRNLYIYGSGAPGGQFRIAGDKAWVAEAANLSSPTPDVKPDTMTEFPLNHYNYGWTNTWVDPSTGETNNWIYNYDYFYAYNIPCKLEKEKSYIVTYLVDPGKGNPVRYTETNPGVPGSYLLPAATADDTTNAVWSTMPALTTSPWLMGLYYMYPSPLSNGWFTSQVADTLLEDPIYKRMSWSQYLPNNSYIYMKVRAGDQDDLSDAPAWSNCTAYSSAPVSLNALSGRYVQFQAELVSDPYGWDTPKLKDVTIEWNGELRVADIGGTFTVGPDYGIFEVTVDGKILAKGVTVDLEIYEDVRTFQVSNTRLTSAMTAEIEPRNSGK